MPVAAETKRARLPLAGGAEGAGVRVHPMRTARMLAMPHFFQRPSGPLPTLRGLGLLTSRSRFIPVPIPAFLVEHPTAGPVLVDTGMRPRVAQDGPRALGRAFALAVDDRDGAPVGGARAAPSRAASTPWTSASS